MAGWFDENDPYAGANQGGASDPNQSAPGHGVPGTVGDPSGPGPGNESGAPRDLGGPITATPGPAPGPTPGPSPYGNAPGLPNLADFKSPDPLKPWTGTFHNPTAEEVANTPGFQFNLGEGLKALQHSAAAKGTLLTGGTLKASNQYATDYANTKYQDAYNNAYNTYESNRTDFLTNEANRYNSQRTNMNDQWGINSDYFNMGRANRLDNFNIFNTNRGFDYGVSNDNRNFGRTLNNDYWQHMFDYYRSGQPPAPTP